MGELMRRDITYVNGVELEKAVEITKHNFFSNEERAVVEREIRSYTDFNIAYGEMLKYRNYEQCLAQMHESTGRDVFHYNGYCAVCNSEHPFVVDFRFAEEVNGKRILNWRERLVCPNCGCSSRQRFIIGKIFEHYTEDMQVLIYEQASNLFDKIRRTIPEVVGFEYVGDGCKSKTVICGIDCENICGLSYPDEKFSLVVSNDVFEYTYDYEKAFKEACRVLKPGGKMLFTVPFDGNSDVTLRRVEINENGLVHTSTPWYHGCPVTGQSPLLVYEIFGWDILDILKQCGFSDAYAKVYYGIEDGYMGYLPLYFEAVK